MYTIEKYIECHTDSNPIFKVNVCNHPTHYPLHTINIEYDQQIVNICEGCGYKGRYIRFPTLKQLQEKGIL